MRSKTSPTGLNTRSFIEEARRRQIIEATIEAIAEDGYAGASLAKLAARAKISKSIISYHFAGKDELLENTVQAIYVDIWNFVYPRLIAQRTARDQLRAYIESEFAYLEAHRTRLLTITYILMNHRDKNGTLHLLEQAEKTNLSQLGQMLEAGQKSGEFRSFAITPMAVTLMHSINGALGHWVAHSDLSLANYARELVTIFDFATRNETSPTRRKNYSTS